MPVEITQFDLPAFAAKGARMVVRHPATGEPIRDKDGKEAALILAGSDSDRWRDAERRNVVELSAERAERGDDRAMTAEDFERQDARRRRSLVAVTLGWENISINGETALTPALATDLYLKNRWLAEQALNFLSDRRNYLPPGPATHAGE